MIYIVKLDSLCWPKSHITQRFFACWSYSDYITLRMIVSYDEDDLQSKLCFHIFMMMLSVKVIQIAGRMIVDYYDESLMICKVGNVFNYDGIIFNNSTVPQKYIFEIWDYFDNKKLCLARCRLYVLLSVVLPVLWNGNLRWVLWWWSWW